MKRIEFVKRIAGLIILPTLMPTASLSAVGTKTSRGVDQKGQEIYTGEVAGVAYYEAPDVIHEMQVGDSLQLIRESNNQYDAKAIAIYFKHHKIGYMAKRHNKIFSRMLDIAHGRFEANITYLYGEEYPYLTVEYRVLSVG